MSIINLHSKVVFIHVPKSGGTSMRTVPWLGGRDHQSLRSFLVRGDLTSENASTFFKFAFVRNPYDRLLSAFCFLGTTPPYCNSPRPECARAAEYIKEFYSIAAAFAEYVDELEDEWVQRDASLRPQWFFTTGANGVSLDFIGRFENLQNDFNYVCDQVDKPQARLPHTHKTEHPEAWRVYTNAMRDKVYGIYERDFKIFGYDRTC